MCSTCQAAAGGVLCRSSYIISGGLQSGKLFCSLIEVGINNFSHLQMVHNPTPALLTSLFQLRLHNGSMDIGPKFYPTAALNI